MSTAARIDELRRKFDENPRRYFAPLANELRKAGELSQAIGLCREHLPKQPGHMSGYIVYGQALFESGALVEARTVFEQALALDPENLIALRHLGDIAKAGGDTAIARRWYERVLDADPRNDDIASQLASLTPTPALVPESPRVVRQSTPFGAPAIPAQDAGLRAVDLDAVDASFNARPMRYTPLDLDAMTPDDDAGARRPTPFGVPPVPEPNARSLDDVLGAFAANDPSHAMQSTEFGLVSSRAEVFHGELVDDSSFVDSGEPEPLEGFEEGLIAPEWPADTSELVARNTSPRSLTPLASPVSPDAIAAFGEQTDERNEVPERERDQNGDDVAHVADFVDSHADISPAVTAQTPPPIGWADEPEAPAVSDVVAFEADDASLPWLSTASHASSDGSDHELDDFAAAFSEDARRIGEDPLPALTDADGENVFAAEVSFADVLHGTDDTNAEATMEPQGERQLDPRSSTPTFVTATMAELLVSQGFVDRAIEVYEQLVRQRPHDNVAAARLAELRLRTAPTADAPQQWEDASVAQSESEYDAMADEAFADTTPETVLRVDPSAFNTPPISVPVVQDTGSGAHRSYASLPISARPTPPYATPLSSAAAFLTPPFSGTVAAVAGATVVASQMTARVRFSRLAARRVARRTPPQPFDVIEEPTEGLSSLFRAEPSGVGDDAAARALADAFAPVTDAQRTDGGLFEFDDELIDDRTPPTGRAAIGGQSVSHPSPAPMATPIINQELSFDRFFPDPATAARPTASAGADVQPAKDESVSSSDDLAQFSAWLKGLGSK